ncbi:MAG: hypothetical protein HY398_00920, partial [Candidatus Doudnabacteria bacterium]|nr:hypothetical protein [Candidatus Doudnabacteria bacterium]
GDSRTILFQARVQSSGLSNGQILNNVGFAFSSSQTKSDNARVVIEVPISPVRQLHILKTVRNDSTNSGFASSVAAAPGQILTFQIIVDTNGSNVTQETVIVKDALPLKLTFNAGTLNVDGVDKSAFANAFFSSGINIGPMAPNTSKVVQFRVTVASTTNFPVGCELLTNVGSVESVDTVISPPTTVGPFTSTATVNVCKEAAQKTPGQPVNRPTA